MTEGYKSEAEGYVASLRQQAKWVRECKLDGTIDADELDAAADFIDRLSASAQAPGNPSREAIATIIAGDIYGTPDGWVGPATRSARADGLKKADAILALSPAQAGLDPSTMEVCAKIADQVAINSERRAAGHTDHDAQEAAFNKMEGAQQVALRIRERASALPSADRHCEFCHVPMAAADCCDSEFEAKGCLHSSTHQNTEAS